MSDTPENKEAPQRSETEQRAMEQGWRPKDEFQGDPERFIDAGEFLRRGELFDKIDQQNRALRHQDQELKNVKQTLDQFKQHHANVEKAAYDRAIADIKKQRKEALADGDVDKFDQLETRMEQLKDERDKFVQNIQAQARQPKQEVPQVAPELQAWVAKNKWYETDVIMQGAADRYGTELAKQGIAPEEVLRRVEAKIKEEFPHKFTNPNRDRASAVDTPARNGGTGTKSNYQPSEAERQIAKNFVRAGLYKTEREYYAELEKMEKGN